MRLGTQRFLEGRFCRSVTYSLTFLFAAGQVGALPQGGVVAHGNVEFEQVGNQLTVHQASGAAIVNYGSFNISGGEIVRFNQPGGGRILNRVVGGGGSTIAGALFANGQVYLVNPQGIVFTGSARVNVGGLVASGMNMSDGDFLAGRDFFSGGGGSVVNNGSLNGGFVYLVGRNVQNNGAINAGRVALASGQQSVQIDTLAGGRVRLIIDGVDQSQGESEEDPAATDTEDGSADTAGEGEQTADTTGGDGESDSDVVDAEPVATDEEVAAGADPAQRAGELAEAESSAPPPAAETAATDTAPQSPAAATEPTPAAAATATEAATAPAAAATQHLATQPAASPDSSTTAAETPTPPEDQLLLATEQSLAANTGLIEAHDPIRDVGGSIAVAGEIVVNEGALRADGDLGGGDVSVTAADTIVLRPGSVISADAKQTGDGGNVLVLAQRDTHFQTGAEVSARGGAQSGDGGHVEVSGLQNIGLGGTIDTTAPRGRTGTTLIDPAFLNIIDGAGPGDQDANLPAILAGDPDTALNTVAEQTLEALAAGTMLTLQATGDIRVDNLTDNLLNLALDPTGSFTLESTGGAIRFLDTADEIRTAGAPITFDAGTEVIAGLLSSGGGTITVTAGDTIFLDGAIDSDGGDVNIDTANPAGTITIAAAGGIDASNAGAGGNITIATTDADLDILGDLATDGAGTISASAGGGDTTIDGALLSSDTGAINLSADNDLTTVNNPIIQAPGGGDVTLVADADNDNSGDALLNDPLHLPGGGDLTVRGETITADALSTDTGGAIDLLANATLTLNGPVDAVGGGDLTATATAGDLTAAGPLTADGAGTITASAGGDLTAAGVTTAGGDIDLDAQANLAPGDITTGGGDATLDSLAVGTIDLRNIDATGGGNVTVTTADGDINTLAGDSIATDGAGAIAMTANGNATLAGDQSTAAGDIDIAATSGGDITVDAALLSAATGDITLSADNDLTTLNNPIIQTPGGGDITLVADADADNNGDALLNDPLHFPGGGDLTVRGETVTADALSTDTGGAIDLLANATMTLNGPVDAIGGGNVTVRTTDGDLTATGPLTADGAGTITAEAGGTGSLDLSGASTDAGLIDLDAAVALLINGPLDTAGGDIQANADIIQADAAITPTAGGDVTLTTATGDLTLNPGGAVTADTTGTVTLNAGGDLNALDSITSAAGAIDLLAGGVINQFAAATTTGGDYTANAGTTYNNTGGTIGTAGGAIDIDAADAVTLAAVLDSGGAPITVDSANNTITVAADVSGGDITMNAAAGLTVQATANLTGTPGAGGMLTVGGGVTLLGTADPNASAIVLNGGGLDITLGGVQNFDQNTTFAPLRDILLVAATITSDPGVDIVLNADSDGLANTDGLGTAFGGVSIDATSSIAGGGTVTITGNQLVSQPTESISIDGAVTGNGTVTLTGGAANTIDINAAVESTTADLDIDNQGDIAIDANLTAATAIDIDSTAGQVAQPAGTIDAPDLAVAADTGINLGDTTIDNLSAVNQTSGDLVVHQSAGNLSLDQVSQNGPGKTVIDAAADLTVAGGGSGVAAGTGHLLLNAANTLNLDNTVTGGGDVSLTANAINQAAAGDVTAGGTLDAEATGGDITMADGATATSTGNLRYFALGNITLGNLASAAAISVNASAGDITDASAAGSNLAAPQARLAASASIGTAADPIDLSVSTLAAAAGLNLFLANDTAVTIDNVIDVQVNRLNAACVVSVVGNGAATSDLVAGNHLVLVNFGDITLNDGGTNPGQSIDGTGNVLLRSTTGNLTINSDLLGGADFSALAALAINQNADITTAGGTIDVDAGTDLVMLDGTVATSAGGNIRYAAGNDITLGQLNAGIGLASVEAGRHIIDTDTLGSDVSDVIASQIRLNAAAGNIGDVTAPGTVRKTIEVAGGTIGANAAGTLSLQIDSGAAGNAGPVSVNRVAADATTTPTADPAINGLNAGAGLALVSGSTINLNTPIVTGGGNIYVEAQGATSDIVLNADLNTSAGGHVTFIAGRDVLQNADITTGGGHIYIDAGDRVTMAALTQSLAAGGNIRLAAVNDINVSLLDAGAGGGVSLLSTAGAILGGTVRGDRAILDAATSVGDVASMNFIDTAVNTLAASAGAGGVALADADAVTIGDVAIDTIFLDACAQVLPAPRMDTLAGLASPGNVVAKNTTGTLTIQDPVSGANILLQAQGATDNVDIQGTVDATADLSVLAGNDIDQSADITAGGTIDLDAGNDIAQTLGTRATATGELRANAGNDITAAHLAAGTIASLEAGGAILDGGDTNPDIEAAAARLNATTAIGDLAGGNALDTDVDTIAANAGAGGVNLRDTDDVTVGTVTPAGVNRVAMDGTSAALGPDAAIVGETSAGGLVQRAAGDLTVDQAVAATANLRLESETGDLTINADANSTAGNLSAIAANNLLQNANLTTTGGTIDQEATSGDLTMAAGASSTTGGGNLRARAGDDLTITRLDAGAGDASLVAGRHILDGDAAEGADLIADNARLNAGGDIGTLTPGIPKHIEVTANTLSADAGGVLGLDTTATIGATPAVAVNRVAADGTVTPVTDAAQNGLAAAGNISLLAPATLTIDQAVQTSAGGHIFVRVAVGDLNLNADLDAAGQLALDIAADLNQNAGDLIAAADLHIAVGNDITMAAGTRSAGANIAAVAGNDITLTEFNAGTGDLLLEATAGHIRDTTGAGLVAANALLQAGTEIGNVTAGDLIQTDLDTVAADASGDIGLDDASDLVIGSVNISVDGLDDCAVTIAGPAAALAGLQGAGVSVESAGSLTVADPVVGTMDLRLEAGTDLALNNTVDATGDASLLADRDITQTAAGDVTAGGTLDAEAGRDLTMADGGTFTATGPGDLRAAAANDVTLGAVDAGTGNASILATAGRILDTDTAGGDVVDVRGADVRLQSGTSIGDFTAAPTDPEKAIEVSATADLAAQSGAISLELVGPTTIGSAGPVTVQRQGADLTDTPVTDAQLDGLDSMGGGLALIGNDTITIGLPIDSAGGHIHIAANGAASDIVLNNSLTSGGGHTTLVAGRSVLQNALGSIDTSAGGHLFVEAQTGLITMNAAAASTTDGGNIRYAAAGDITVSLLDAAAGNLALLSSAGSILGGQVTGAAALFDAAGGVGDAAGGNLIQTTLDTVAAIAGAGGVGLSDSDSITIGDVDVTTIFIDACANIDAASPRADMLAGHTTRAGSNGDIVQIAANGLTTDAAVDADGTGNILLDAQGGDAVLNADTTSDDGDISVLASATIDQNADIATSAGTIDQEAGADIDMADGATSTATGNGEVRLDASGDITLGGVDAGNAIASLTAGGAILDGGDADTDVAGTAARLRAGTSIGNLAGTLPEKHIETDVDTVAAEAGAGGIGIADADALAVGTVTPLGVNRVADTGTSAALGPDPALAGLTTTPDGHIVQTAGGDLTVADPVAAGGARIRPPPIRRQRDHQRHRQQRQRQRLDRRRQRRGPERRPHHRRRRYRGPRRRPGHHDRRHRRPVRRRQHRCPIHRRRRRPLQPPERGRRHPRRGRHRHHRQRQSQSRHRHRRRRRQTRRGRIRRHRRQPPRNPRQQRQPRRPRRQTTASSSPTPATSPSTTCR